MRKIVMEYPFALQSDSYIREVSLRWIYTLIFFCILHQKFYAQVFSDLEGDELFTAVVDSYKPNFVETYSVARTLMYKVIYNEHDSVHTIYSDHKLYIDPDEQLPIQFLAMNGTANGISTEHIYPRSKGAKEEYGNAFSDLHNLAPARWAVNEARSNFAFAEINDSETDRWFYKDDVMLNAAQIPNDQMDNYSEVDGYQQSFGFFEPRESVKGDVARSVMYFYTMYREEAMREDSRYFDEMRADLCAWHNADPVDEIELKRNEMKALVQDGKHNPFILDCTVANRLYCPEYNIASCNNLTTSIDDSFILGEPLNPSIKIYPNPSAGIFTLDISNITPGNYQVDIFFMSGELIYSLQEELDYFNSINMWNAKRGNHIIHLTNKETGRKYSGLFEIIK